jgi:type IV pilus assembly protein PilQ
MKRIFMCLVLSLLVIMSSICLAQTNKIIQNKLDQKVTSLEFRDTNIRDLLRMLSRQYNLNIVVNSEVAGRVSVSLTNVTVENVLKTVLNSQGYHYIIDDDIIMVKAFEHNVYGETKNKLFRLKYIDANELSETLLPLMTQKGDIRVLQLVKTENLEERRSDILLVKDIPSSLEQISSIIDELDKPQDQLIIEVRLIETILNESEKFGIDWPDRANLTLTGADPSGTSDYLPGDAFDIGKAGYSKFPVTKDNIKLGILTADELSVTLNALAEDENSKLISNPKVTTLNNQTAMIRIGTNIPIPQVNRGIGGDLITYEDKQVDVKLQVTPRIQPGNNINLIVHPEIEEIVGYTATGDFPQPITSVREIQTKVNVKTNETIVLGGMVKDNERTIENKVWLLGDIPFLGALFKSTEKTVEKKDLLIFITPKIIKK